MKTSEHFRGHLFWFLDTVNGMPVRNHYKEINFLMNQATQDEVININRKKLFKLLDHASVNCPYYYEFKGKNDLSLFPVVNKNLIKENTEKFLAVNYNNKQLLAVTTSGSTGTPFKTYQDCNKKKRNNADTLYFAELAGYKLGHRLIYLKIWVKKKMRSRLEYWFQNIVPIDVLYLNDAKIELLISKINNERSTFSIIGYSSALELICKFLDRINAGTVKANIKSIIAISETLNDYTKSKMEKYFGNSVVSRYSNLENGIIAQQELNGSGWFLINTPSYHVEILEMNTDEQVNNGKLGRIVVTDLFNYAMPMIRYDTGDIGAIKTDPLNSARKYLSKVEGRKLDLLYDTRGNLISSYIVYKNMWQYTEIDQYQLIQEKAKQYTLKINSKSHFKKEKQLVEEFKSFLGWDAEFKFEYVSEIPLLASGKRKKIVNNYINT